MKRIRVLGGQKLSGTITISGSKNSAVALVPASLLSDEIVEIDNVPNISDIDALSEILEYLGAKVERNGTSMKIDSTNVTNKVIPEEISKKLRASYYFMGALLGKYKKVEMYFPGGCSIGERPINLHLKGFEALGATVTEEGNKYIVEAEELKGANIYLDIASVGATINLMLASVFAKGITIIGNAAKEPHIVNVATFLNQMGASITGAGTSEIRIQGVEKLSGCFHEVVPDYIETGTYLIAGALCGENLKIENAIPDHLEALLSKLKEIGVILEAGKDYITISKGNNYKAVSIKTAVYPGFPTDLQQPFMTLLTQCQGLSKVEENIFENRFMHIPYLNEMGASITASEKVAFISGKTALIGKEVEATDLRAGASLILAALCAEGETVITKVEHVLRGYEGIIEKLQNVGAKIELEEIE
ncbi:MAG: UDP-N-acetylglucosamine 1-carboxyvinyltransferase [Bacilli bacterium]|jgi:UDP-N-acetylglucosamine 1-carboxyvinyltransferase|nr:UDP-N-acetylglucosamine 1-carboxyvinyltransferase [Bacilli bacterium]